MEEDSVRDNVDDDDDDNDDDDDDDDDLLSDVHGRRWFKRDPEDVNGQDDFHGSHLKSTINTKLTLGAIFDETVGKTPLDFFHHFYTYIPVL